jgi:guanylate kinase
MISVSHTTRKQRPGELHGEDYFFIEREAFEAKVAERAFLEHAQVFGNYYGTAKATVEEALAADRDVLLEIDWQGARQIKALMPDACAIFILPPSRAALSQRLHGRGQDDAETIAGRMREAISEMSHFAEYDYLVVNDDFEAAVQDLIAIVKASRLRAPLQAARLQAVIDGLLEN